MVIINLRRRRLRSFILFCILMISSLYLLQAKWVWRIFYPWPYRTEVTAAANKTGIDPYLLAAVIRVESRFNPQAVSSAGAIGMMQVMPDTANWVANQISIDGFQPSHLYRPQTNLAIGSWYLAHLYQQFKGNRIAGLAAYNAGHGKVNGWLQSGEWNGSVQDLDRIPYKETEMYIKNVLGAYERYKYLYGGGT